jgi:hypothetical protein
MRVYRLYADEEGESHLEELDLPMTSMEFAPPAPPLDVSEFKDAKRVGLIRGPAGWFGDWHPAPKRQIMFHLTGQLEAETSDGERRIIAPGTMVLVEDTAGKGHRSRVIGTEDVYIGVVQLED